jgi:putative hydrolase of the HAD superfamily
MKMIRSIIFDWGGVLIDEPSPKIFTICAKAFQISTTKFIHIYERYKQDFQRGQLSETTLWNNISSELEIPHSILAGLWGVAFQGAYKEKKEIFTLASFLQSKGYKIGFLSNTEVPAMEFFLKQQYSMFDVTVFSCMEGTRKPEKKIYEVILNRLHVAPQEAVFIDDTKEYVQGAEQVGIHTILFRNFSQLRKQLASFSIPSE